MAPAKPGIPTANHELREQKQKMNPEIFREQVNANERE